MKRKIILLLSALVTACSVKPYKQADSAPVTVPIDVYAVADAVPRHEKRTRAGNPSVYEVLGKQYKVLADHRGYKERGIASWYGTKFHGRKTANGENYDMYAMTAAHKTLPIPSYVRVTNLKNQRSVILRINDRGPFHENRIIDLSYTAAAKLHILKTGTGFVEVTALDVGQANPKLQSDFEHYKTTMPVFIQVGAFNNQLNAMALQEKLMDWQSINSTIQIIRHPGDDFYKVQVGPLASLDQAEKINEKLVARGLKQTRLIFDADK